MIYKSVRYLVRNSFSYQIAQIILLCLILLQKQLNNSFLNIYRLMIKGKNLKTCIHFHALKCSNFINNNIHSLI